MIFGCLHPPSPSALPTRIDFLVSNRERGFVACLAIAKRASSRSFGAQKNGLRQLRDGTLRLVRPLGASCARFVQWGYAHLSRL